MRDIDRILEALDRVRHRADGWLARCPAHDDGHPSLSLKAGDDGRILLHCFAGCRPEAILTALGLTWQDILPERTDADGHRVIPRPTPQYPSDDIGGGRYRIDPFGWGQCLRLVESWIAAAAGERPVKRHSHREVRRPLLGARYLPRGVPR
jgi:hypothetical protein